MSFHRKPKAPQLTAWLVGACFGACAIYDVPEKPVADPGDEMSGGAGIGGSGTSSVAGDGGTASGSPSAGKGSTPSGGAPTAGGGGGASGSMMPGAAGEAAEGGEGGTAGAGSSACPDCAALREALLHRYDFEGSGTAVMDRVGTAHGTVVGGGALSTVDGKGVLVLGGGTSGPYVDLPNQLVSPLTSATFEAWVSWAGGNAWQRIFDFGDSTAASPENNPASGKSYLFLTTATSTNGVMRTAYSTNGIAGGAETHADAAASLPLSLSQVVVVVDATGGQLLLYQDGKVVGGQAFSGALGSINDVNCWLGRSQYEADPELDGTFHDFRIYDAALTASQIAASFAGGPDPAFLLE